MMVEWIFRYRGCRTSCSSLIQRLRVKIEWSCQIPYTEHLQAMLVTRGFV